MGKRREMGLGSVASITLADARRRAAEARHQLTDGLDPVDERRRNRSRARKEIPLTFADIAKRYIKEMAPGWRDPRSASVWTSSLERLAYPQLGAKQVTDIGTDDVLSVLRPIWENKTETADRLRGRIERILDYATTHDWRTGENPARWRGHLANILPKPSSVASATPPCHTQKRHCPRYGKTGRSRWHGSKSRSLHLPDCGPIWGDQKRRLAGN